MKLSKAEQRHLRMALHSAIQWEDSLADAHHTGYNKINSALPRTVPREWRGIVARCKRRIAAYERLLEKLRPTSTPGASK